MNNETKIVTLESLNTKIDSLVGLVGLVGVVDKLAISMNSNFTLVKNDIGELKTKVNQIDSDLQSFKTEIRERFDKTDDRLDKIDETAGAIIKDYHPHIIALEEKVFGSSTLAEV